MEFKNILKSLLLLLLLAVFGSAARADYTEQIGRCITKSSDAPFPIISLQRDQAGSGRGILVRVASDGLLDVFTGMVHETAQTIIFASDAGEKVVFTKVLDAGVNTDYMRASYSCERSQ